MCPYRFHCRFCTQDREYRLCACQGACINTLFPLYSIHLVKGFDHARHPDESLARKSVYLQPVTGCKSGVRATIYAASHKCNTVGDAVYYCLPGGGGKTSSCALSNLMLSKCLILCAAARIECFWCSAVLESGLLH